MGLRAHLEPLRHQHVQVALDARQGHVQQSSVAPRRSRPGCRSPSSGPACWAPGLPCPVEAAAYAWRGGRQPSITHRKDSNDEQATDSGADRIAARVRLRSPRRRFGLLGVVSCGDAECLVTDGTGISHAMTTYRNRVRREPGDASRPTGNANCLTPINPPEDDGE